MKYNFLVKISRLILLLVSTRIWSMTPEHYAQDVALVKKNKQRIELTCNPLTRYMMSQIGRINEKDSFSDVLFKQKRWSDNTASLADYRDYTLALTVDDAHEKKKFAIEIKILLQQCKRYALDSKKNSSMSLKSFSDDHSIATFSKNDDEELLFQAQAHFESAEQARPYRDQDTYVAYRYPNVRPQGWITITFNEITDKPWHDEPDTKNCCGS